MWIASYADVEFVLIKRKRHLFFAFALHSRLNGQLMELLLKRENVGQKPKALASRAREQVIPVLCFGCKAACHSGASRAGKWRWACQGINLVESMVQGLHSLLPASGGVRSSMHVDGARGAAAFGLYSSFPRLNGGVKTGADKNQSVKFTLPAIII